MIPEPASRSADVDVGRVRKQFVSKEFIAVSTCVYPSHGGTNIRPRV